jgi:Ca2+-transporting ATPase
VFYHYGASAVSGLVVDELRLTQAQTAAFMTVIMVHIFYLLTARSLTESAFKRNPFSNKWVFASIILTVALHILMVYVLPNIGINPFRVAPIPIQWWIPIVSLGLLGLFAVELEEFLVKRLKGHRVRA